MTLGDDLTTEKIKAQFKNNFELANYAIRIIRHMIRSGKEMDLDVLLYDLSINPNKYNIEELENAKLEENSKKVS